jgi:hypothetical protein
MTYGWVVIIGYHLGAVVTIKQAFDAWLVPDACAIPSGVPCLNGIVNMSIVVLKR